MAPMGSVRLGAEASRGRWQRGTDLDACLAESSRWRACRGLAYS